MALGVRRYSRACRETSLMPFIEVVHTSRTPRRVLNQGGPNSGKTHAFLTWPRHLKEGDDYAAWAVCLPGEKGYDTLPTDLPDLHVRRWESSPAEKTSSKAVLDAVERLVLRDILGTGKVTSLLMDGAHKLYEHALNYVTGGAFFSGEEFEPRLYSRAHEIFKYFLDRVNSTPTPYIVWTVWDGREMDKPELKSASPTHIFPDFPGKMAKRVMGEFSVVVYSNLQWENGAEKSLPGIVAGGGGAWGGPGRAPVRRWSPDCR